MFRNLRTAMAIAAISCLSLLAPGVRAADIVFTDLSDSGRLRSLNSVSLKVTEIARDIKIPYGVAVLPNKDYLVASWAGEIIRVTPSGMKSVFAKPGGNIVGVYAEDDGTVYFTDYARGDQDKGRFGKIAPDGKIAIIASNLTGPADIAKRENGEFVVSNYSGGPTRPMGAPTAAYNINPETGALSIAQTTSGLVCPFGVMVSGSTLWLGAAESSRVTRKDGTAPQAVWASSTLLKGVMDLVTVDGEMWAPVLNSGNFVKLTQKLGANGPYIEVTVALKVGGMPVGAVVLPEAAPIAP